MKIHDVGEEYDLIELDYGEVFKYDNNFYMTVDRLNLEEDTIACVHLLSGEYIRLSGYCSVIHKPKARLLTEG